MKISVGLLLLCWLVIAEAQVFNVGAGIGFCDLGPCRNGGTCEDLGDDYRCTCKEGYTGIICSTNINDCDPNPCKNGGMCTDLVADYKCECKPGYFGMECGSRGRTSVLPKCNNDNCINGQCKRVGEREICKCIRGYTGIQCNKKI